MNQPHQIKQERAQVMPKDYIIHPYDVLNGRGKMAFNNVGNRRFRVTLSLALKKYQNASNRQDKSKLIISIVQLVRSNGGRFLTRSNKRWIEIGDRAAREKVGHALRDMVGASVAKAKREAVRSRPISPSCVVQDPAEDPLDVSFAGDFPDQYINVLCDALSDDGKAQY